MALVVGAVGLGGCSADDDGSAGARDAAGTTLATVVAVTTTTAVPGEPVDAAAAYAAAGFTPEQRDCVVAAGVDGDFEISPGVALGDATVLTAEDGTMIAVPASVRTGAEVERLILDALAADCAPPDRLDALASTEGAASDAAALADDLPAHLLARRADGATAKEQTCLEQGFTAAPALLSSLVARPLVVESACAPAERRAAWRTAALTRGLEGSGVADPELACIVGDPEAQLLLASAVDALGSGDAASDPMRDATNDCFAPGRLQQLALELVARPPDLGVEQLAPTPAAG